MTAREDGSEDRAISLTEFEITGPSHLRAGPVTFVVSNEGATAHNLVVRSLNNDTTEFASSDIAAGGKTKLDLISLSPGDYEFYCSIPGHLQAGMVQAFVVTDSP